MFDELPQMTYEKIGLDYVGSVVDSDGDVIFSEYLGYKSWGDAFGGRELTLHMKDGSVKKIKDNWWDCGYCKEHGEFIDIGAGTLESLQDCYVYCGYNINKIAFQKMLDDYYFREKEYGYDEIREWCKLQYKWYDVIIDGEKYPYMVNEKGNFVHKYSKESIYPRENRCIYRFKSKGKTDKSFDLCLFKMNYEKNGRLIKIERRMLDVLKESLPFSEAEIVKRCNLK